MHDRETRGGEPGSDPTALLECAAAAALTRQITRAIENWGGHVFVGESRENLCRSVRGCEIPNIGPVKWVVESQGLPNLIHEFVHALYLGCLAEDHGFDYGLIPLDLAERSQRRWLWEELACCSISAAYAAVHAAEPDAFIAHWFAEQVEIQGVFHGLEDDLRAYQAHIDGALGRPGWGGELDAVVEQGYAALEEALLGVGAPQTLARPSRRLHPAQLWAHYRSSETPLAAI